LLYYHVVTKQCASNGDTLVLTLQGTGKPVTLWKVSFGSDNRINPREKSSRSKAFGWRYTFFCYYGLCIPYGVEVFFGGKLGVI